VRDIGVQNKRVLLKITRRMYSPPEGWSWAAWWVHDAVSLRPGPEIGAHWDAISCPLPTDQAITTAGPPPGCLWDASLPRTRR
jgi:hypothetical protein